MYFSIQLTNHSRNITICACGYVLFALKFDIFASVLRINEFNLDILTFSELYAFLSVA